MFWPTRASLEVARMEEFAEPKCTGLLATALIQVSKEIIARLVSVKIFSNKKFIRNQLPLLNNVLVLCFLF